MKHRDGLGFTLVELIITMVVMAILMALGTVAISGLQAQARDKERESDIDAIARGLEARYANGNPRASGGDDTKKGIYPGANEILHSDGWSRAGYIPEQIVGGYRTDLLPGTSKASFISPSGIDTFNLVCVYACAPGGDQTQLNNAFNNEDRYIYEPMDNNNNICCCSTCYKFNLYWKDESGTIHKVMSKHQ